MRCRIFLCLTALMAVSLLVTIPVFAQEDKPSREDTPREVALLARSARTDHVAFQQDIDKFLAKVSTNNALASELLELAKKNDKEAAAKVIKRSLRPGTEVVVESIHDAFCIDFTATWRVHRNVYTLHIKIGWCD